LSKKPFVVSLSNHPESKVLNGSRVLPSPLILGLSKGPQDDKLFGNIKLIGPRASFPLYQQHAKEYVREGIALVGDAAHSIHPLAGQGVNLGFADAKALSLALIQAKNKGRNIASRQTLLQYQRARRHYNAAVMWSMYGFNALFSSRIS